MNSIKYFTLLLLIILIHPTVNGQIAQDTLYQISDIYDTINLSKKGYFILKLNDNRSNKDNLGSIKERKIKKTLITKDSLDIYLSKIIQPQLNQDSSLIPLIINIEKIKSFASTNGTIDQAELYIKLNAQISNGYEPINIYNFERTFKYQRTSKTTFLSDFIFTSIASSLSALPTVKKSKKVMEYTPENEVQVKTVEETFNLNPIRVIDLSHSDFYLRNIIDNRTNKEDGQVLMGYFNKRVKVKSDSGLVYFFDKSITFQPDTNKTALDLYIKEFSINESLTSLGESGRFIFSADLVLDSLNTKYVIYSKALIGDTILDHDVTKALPDLIHNQLSTYFNHFKNDSSTFVQLDSALALGNERIYKKENSKNKYFWKGMELNNPTILKEALGSNDPVINKYYSIYRKTYITSAIFASSAGLLFGFQLGNYLFSEEENFKKWLNNDNESQLTIFSKKGDLNLGIVFGVSSIILKIVSREYVNKAVKIKNNNLLKNTTLGFTPNLNGYGNTFKLGILISKN